MADREYEAQEVVTDAIIDRGFKIRHSNLLLGFELVTELLMLELEPLVSAEKIDRTMLRSGHQPGARVVWDARLRPLLESGDESILCEVLGNPNIVHDPRQTGDEPGRLNPPDRIDRVMCVGTLHDYRSHHF